MSSNIVWHEASITKEERRSKINIKALFYGLRVYRLQGNHPWPMPLPVDYLKGAIKPSY